MELEYDIGIGNQSDTVHSTQAMRVVDHLLSLLCCGRGHSSLTSIKALGDRLQQQSYLPKEKWEKKHPITRDKIILLNWIKEHISPKDFRVKDALLQCVHDLKLLEDKDLSEIENFELSQAMNILKDIQQSRERDKVSPGSELMLEIKRLSSSTSVSPKMSRKPKDSRIFTERKRSLEAKTSSSHTKGQLLPSTSLKSPSNNEKCTAKTLKENGLTEIEQKTKHSPFLSQRPGSQSSTTDSERSYLHLHREKRAHKQNSDTDQLNQSAGNSNIPVRVPTNRKQINEKQLTPNDKIKRILYHLMLRPSADEHGFCNIVDALGHEMKKKDMKSVLVDYLHQNPPKFSLKHIGFSDGGEWSLFLRTECPDALLAYAIAQKYHVILHVIAIGSKHTEEVKFYPHDHIEGNEERHIFVAYLSDDRFLLLVPMKETDFPSHVRSSDEFQKCLTRIENLEKENKSLRRKLKAVEEEEEEEEDLPSDHKVALSDHVSLRLRRNSNNIEITNLRQQLHLIKMKIEHKRT